MKKLIVADLDKCTGCRICEMFCAFFKEKVFNPNRSRIRIIKMEREGLDIPVFCQQCEDPVCRDVCPVGALSKGSDAVMHLDPERCIGCWACSISCPYGAISFYEGEFKLCDLCEGDPKCAKWCPTEAIQYVNECLADIPRRRVAAESLARQKIETRRNQMAGTEE
jgi:Fe-S-cluster-containing hydrogenase component 2